MLDVAAHMLLLQRQAKIKHESPADGSFLPLSLTAACLLRQLPAGLAPPAGVLSFHQIDCLPIETLEQKLIRLLDNEATDSLSPLDSETVSHAFNFLRAMVVYVKTTRAMLALCHSHMTDQFTTTQTMRALVDVAVANLGGAEEDDEEGVVEDGAGEGRDDSDAGDDEVNPVNRKNEDAESDDLSSEANNHGVIGASPRKRISMHSNRSRRRSRHAKATLHSAPMAATESRFPSVAFLPTTATAVDPSGIVKRALARDAGDGSAIIGIMKKYPTDLRIQTHGVRALKSVIRKFPLPSRPQLSSEVDSNSVNKYDTKEPIDPDEKHRRDVVQLVLQTMKQYPDHLPLQRDALFCLLDYASRADKHVATIASLGGIAAILEAMSRLPDDDEAQIAALSVLGHPTIADDAVVRVNPESRRLVLSAMQRLPLSERVQGLACLALANLSLRQDESMREIVARGGLELVVAAMKRFSDVSHIQAAGCWLLTIVSTNDDEMLVRCLDAGGLSACEKARVRFATDPRVQQHAGLAIESLVQDVADTKSNDVVESAGSSECCVQ